jgi:hypothetical protein
MYTGTIGWIKMGRKVNIIQLEKVAKSAEMCENISVLT